MRLCGLNNLTKISTTVSWCHKCLPGMQMLLTPSPAHWCSYPLGLVRIPWTLFHIEKFYGLSHREILKNKSKTQKIHVLVLLNGNKATVKFIFKFVFYTSKYDTAKLKCKAPPTTALFSSVELFLVHTVPCGQYQNLPRQALSSFEFSVFKIS